MLPFFRKIRYKLAKDSQFFKYSRYAIGEIILVVVGILIALQINNWNEERIQSISLKGHLKSLSQAIEHDIKEQSISMEFNEFRFHSWTHLLKTADIKFDSLGDIPRPISYIVDIWPGPYPESVNSDFVKTSLAQLNNPFIDIYFNYSAIDEIKNQGLLSDLKNDTLKKSINNYYYHLDWRFGAQSTNRKYQLAKDLRIYLRDKHGISCHFPPPTEIIIQVINEDQKVAIMFKDLIKTSYDHYWITNELQMSGKNLVDMIHQELDK